MSCPKYSLSLATRKDEVEPSGSIKVPSSLCAGGGSGCAMRPFGGLGCFFFRRASAGSGAFSYTETSQGMVKVVAAAAVASRKRTRNRDGGGGALLPINRAVPRLGKL